ncbi:MAG: PfkB family carbohydrate kinase [Anaerolineae bacterium]
MESYLLIGHIAHDEIPNGAKLGGTVSYSGSTVAALGGTVRIVTSARRDDEVLNELPASVNLHLIDAPKSTTFVNTYIGDTRRQLLLGRAAAPLTFKDIPTEWRDTPVVHLAPLDDEVDPELATAFPNSFVAATAQGWMRAWDAEGVVRPKVWEDAERLLPILDLVVFSEEDIGRDVALEAHYAALAKRLIVTRAANGCTIYQRGEQTMHLPAPQVEVVDATGAGDVFAGVFYVYYYRTGNVLQAAQIATYLASQSVTRVGLAGVPQPQEIQAALNQ